MDRSHGSEPVSGYLLRPLHRENAVRGPASARRPTPGRGANRGRKEWRLATLRSGSRGAVVPLLPQRTWRFRRPPSLARRRRPHCSASAPVCLPFPAMLAASIGPPSKVCPLATASRRSESPRALSAKSASSVECAHRGCRMRWLPVGGKGPQSLLPPMGDARHRGAVQGPCQASSVGDAGGVQIPRLGHWPGSWPRPRFGPASTKWRSVPRRAAARCQGADLPFRGSGRIPPTDPEDEFCVGKVRRRAMHWRPESSSLRHAVLAASANHVSMRRRVERQEALAIAPTARRAPHESARKRAGAAA